MATAPVIPHGAWPALMSARTAAGYVDEPSVEAFLRAVGSRYPAPRYGSGKRGRWLRKDLDAAIGNLADEEEVDAAAADRVFGCAG